MVIFENDVIAKRPQKFWKFIFQERQIRILICSFHCLYFKLFTDNKVQYQIWFLEKSLFKKNYEKYHLCSLANFQVFFNFVP